MELFLCILFCFPTLNLSLFLRHLLHPILAPPAYPSPYTNSLIMNTPEAKLCQINSFLGGGITSLLSDSNCKLYFESTAEANKEGKHRKPCIVYIIGDSFLICRPRKYSKRYYVKYQLPIQSIHLEDRNEVDSRQSVIILSIHDRFQSVVHYFVVYTFRLCIMFVVYLVKL